jgi:hypothetical protein
MNIADISYCVTVISCQVFAYKNVGHHYMGDLHFFQGEMVFYKLF